MLFLREQLQFDIWVAVEKEKLFLLISKTDQLRQKLLNIAMRHTNQIGIAIFTGYMTLAPLGH